MKKIVLVLICALSVFLPSCATTTAQLSNEALTSLRLAGFAIQQKNYPAAIEYFNEVLKQYPSYAEAYCDRAITYYHMDMIEAAYSDFDRAIKLNPRFTLAYYNRGVVYTKNGEYAKARADFIKVLKLDPKRTAAANFLEELGDYGLQE